MTATGTRKNSEDAIRVRRSQYGKASIRIQLDGESRELAEYGRAYIRRARLAAGLRRGATEAAPA